MVSIHRPTGYGPVALPLRHSAYYTYAIYFFIMGDYKRNCWATTSAIVTPRQPPQAPPRKFWQSGGSCSAEG